MRLLLASIALLFAVPLVPAHAQAPTAVDDSAVTATVRAFHLAVARQSWGDAALLVDSASAADFHRRGLLYVLSWAAGHDSLPPVATAFNQRAPVPPRRMLAVVDSGVLARHGQLMLPRYAPGITVATFARTTPRDVVERIILLKWTEYPARALPRFRRVAYTGDSIAHAFAYWPGDSTADDPYRTTVMHLRKRGGAWRMLATAPLFYQADFAFYAIPRPELAPLRAYASSVTLASGPDRTVERMAVTSGRPMHLDPEMMTRADSAAWAAAARAAAAADTVVVRSERIELLQHDTLPFSLLAAAARDRRGRPVHGFVTLYRLEPGPVARAVAGGITGVAPGEAKLVVSAMVPPSMRVAGDRIPATTVTVVVKPRGDVPTALARETGDWHVSHGDGFSLFGWTSPRQLVPGDTVYVRATLINTGSRAADFAVRSCGGVELLAPRGLVLRDGVGWAHCPRAMQTLEPGDSVAGEAWAVVEGAKGNHRLGWSVASPAGAPSAQTRFTYLTMSEPAPSLRPRSGVPTQSIAGVGPRQPRPPYGPPRRLPYVVDATVSPNAMTNVTEEQVHRGVAQALQGSFGLVPYRVSAEAMARTVDVPHVVFTFLYPDVGRDSTRIELAKIERGADGRLSVARACMRGGSGPGRQGRPPFDGSALLLGRLLEVRDLLRQVERGECRP